MRSDLLLNEDNSPLVDGGDFVWGESSSQEVAQLLENEQGNLLFAPLSGVGLRSYLLDEVSPIAIQGEIVEQLAMDGFANVRVTENNGKLKVAAELK